MKTNQDLVVKRLPIIENFKDGYKNFFFVLCISLVIFASALLNKHSTGALSGGLAGLAVQWYMTMIAKAHYSGRLAYENVSDIISKAGYISVTDKRYRHKLGRLLRFDAQDIYLQRVDNGVVAVGPVYMLEHVKRKMGCLEYR